MCSETSGRRGGTSSVFVSGFKEMGLEVFLKDGKLSQCLTSSGRLFHVVDAEWLNALDQIRVLVVTTSRSFDDERSSLVG